MILWPEHFARRGPGVVTTLQAIALVLPLAAVIVERGTAMLPVLASALATAMLWEAAFAVMRRHPVTFHGLTTALIVTIMLPAETPLWQISLAMTLGIVIGEMVFGGRGFSFLSAAAVSLALLTISFPQTDLAEPGHLLGLATLPGAVLLLVFGLVSWRVLLVTPVTLLVFILAAGTPPDLAGIVLALAFGLVFLICDPVASASTGPGRWATSVLSGFLIFLFNTGETTTVLPMAIVSAAVLTSVFAPLVDHLAVLINAALRRRRRG